MSFKDSKNISSLLSVAIHVLLILIFMVWKINPMIEENEFVTIGFGTIGKTSSSGTLTKKQQPAKESEVKKEKKEKAKEPKKKVELPKVINKDENNVITTAKRERRRRETDHKAGCKS